MNKDFNNPWFWPMAILAICILIAPIGVGYFYYFPFDDAFISFRITENLVQNGNALYNPDTKLYTSTSLLYPFWNAIWCKILGKNWIFQISIINGILQSIAIGRILFEVLKNSNSYKISFFVLLAICPLCFNLTHLVYGNTGLETGMYQCFLAFSLCSLNPGKIGWISGLVRPEGFLVGLSGVIASILNKEKLNHIFIQILWGIGILSAYLTISYLLFDDVIPQSIIAKSNYAIDRFAELKSGYLHNFFQGYGFYSFLIGATWFYFPKLQEKLRIPLIWLLMNGLFFSALASWWPWYVPPILIAIIYLSGLSTLEWFKYFNSKPALPSYYISFVIVFFIGFGSIAFWKTIQEARKMSDAVSKRILAGKNIGEWLDKNIPSGKNIMFEQLGLLGYFSKNVEILDYPGLSSRKVSDYVASLPWKIPISFEETQTDSAVLGHFRPDFILLFPKEVKAFDRLQKTRSDYKKIDSLAYYPDSEWFKQVVIFKRSP